MSPRPPIDHIRRPQILAAAAEVIGERGAAATRIADVAERSGVSPAAVLYWFDSKEQLLAEALLADDERFYVELETRLAGATTARARLRALIEISAEDADDCTLWIELWSLALRDEDLRAARERFDARWREEIAAVVRDGRESGEFGDCDPGEVALALTAMIDGLGVQVALGDPEVSRRRLVETVTASAESLLGCELAAAAASASAAEEVST